MTLSTVVTRNDVEKCTVVHSEIPENRGSISYKTFVTTYNRLHDAIILDNTTKFFTNVKSINIYIYTHTQYLSGAENFYDSWLLVFCSVYILLILTSFKTTSLSLSVAEG